MDAARVTSQRALTAIDDDAGPWVRAMVESQMAGLAFQNGDTDLALASMRRALPTMEALGSIDDVVQLRSFEALAELARGDVAAAERALDAMASDERARRSLASIFGANGMAELALAKGEVERGVELYRESLAAARMRTLPGLELDLELTPWVLFSTSCALVARIQHDLAPRAADLAAELERLLPELFEIDGRRRDIPVVGGVLCAVGQWRLVAGTRAPADAVRLLVIGERFGYYRGIPSMSVGTGRPLWQNASRPRVLARVEDEYAGRRAADLLEEAQAVVQRALR